MESQYSHWLSHIAPLDLSIVVAAILTLKMVVCIEETKIIYQNPRIS